MSDDILTQLNVSRETETRLNGLAALIETWSQKINLVSPADQPVLWRRHILDSAQLALLSPDNTRGWVDLGAGAGLPGLVLAILFNQIRPELSVTLVEADGRKAAFLHNAVRELDIKVQIFQQRIELLVHQQADVLSARALAPLTRLLAYTERHLAAGGTAIFPKGRSWEEEVTEARHHWKFQLATKVSLTDDQARILIIKGLSRA